MGPPAQKRFFWPTDYGFGVNQVAYLYNNAKDNEIHSLENIKREKGLSLSSLSLLAAVVRFGLLFSLLAAAKLV
jgi:hypothetical protein